jgi:hypothetical protein
MMPPRVLHCHGNVFTKLLPSNDRGIHFLEPFPSNDRRDIFKNTQTDGRDL